MPFDPCGTRTLEGEDILRILATYLGVRADHLEAELRRLVAPCEESQDRRGIDGNIK